MLMVDGGPVGTKCYWCTIGS